MSRQVPLLRNDAQNEYQEADRLSDEDQDLAETEAVKVLDGGQCAEDPHPQEEEFRVRGRTKSEDQRPPRQKRKNRKPSKSL